MNTAEKIIVALDTNAEQARALARQLKGTARWLKVGMTLFYSTGPQIVAEFKDMGYKVFVDLKLHDIPHQVEGAARAVAQCGADMLTVHAAGGAEMMQAACRGAETGYQDYKSVERIRPLCLAITVLTSLDTAALNSIGVPSSAEEQVLRLAALTQAANMDGIVCSPREIAAVRSVQGADFTLVTPGVRPEGSERGDQARVATPAKALAAGASYLVIGRPITGADDPERALRTIIEQEETSR